MSGNFFPKDDLLFIMGRITILEYLMDILYHVTFMDIKYKS
jgi:hypothetical protein